MKGLTWSSNFLSQISCMLALSLFQLHYLPWQLLECVVSLSKWGSYPQLSSSLFILGHLSRALSPWLSPAAVWKCMSSAISKAGKARWGCSTVLSSVPWQYLYHFQLAQGITECSECEPILNPDFPTILLLVAGMMRLLLLSPVSNCSMSGYPGSGCSRAHPAQVCTEMHFG